VTLRSQAARDQENQGDQAEKDRACDVARPPRCIRGSRRSGHLGDRGLPRL